MPRLRVIVLDQTDPGTYRYVLWADVPAARQTYYANAAATSQWKDAIAADLTALRNGSVVEKVAEQRVPGGSTLAQVEAFLQARWQDFQDQVTAANPWIRYGSTWDGSTWVVQTGG